MNTSRTCSFARHQSNQFEKMFYQLDKNHKQRALMSPAVAGNKETLCTHSDFAEAELDPGSRVRMMHLFLNSAD